MAPGEWAHLRGYVVSKVDIMAPCIHTLCPGILYSWYPFRHDPEHGHGVWFGKVHVLSHFLSYFSRATVRSRWRMRDQPTQPEIGQPNPSLGEASQDNRATQVTCSWPQRHERTQLKPEECYSTDEMSDTRYLLSSVTEVWGGLLHGTVGSLGNWFSQPI